MHAMVRLDLEGCDHRSSKTREVLMAALEAVAMSPEVGRFNSGVLQT